MYQVYVCKSKSMAQRFETIPQFLSSFWINNPSNTESKLYQTLSNFSYHLHSPYN